VNRRATVFLLFALAAGITADAEVPEQTAVITTRSGNIERLEVDAGRLVGASVQELILRHRFRITYEDPRYPNLTDYVDITQQVGVPVPDKRARILWLKNRKMSVDLDTSRGAEGMLNQVVAAAAAVHPEAKFRVFKDGTRYHVVPASGSLLDTRISLPDKPRTVGESLHEIATAVKSASGQAIDYGCCVGQDPDEPRYSVHANNEPAREVMTRLLDSIAAAGRGDRTWLILYEKRFDYFAPTLFEIPDVPVYSMPPNKKGG
jgi:hypothetical protein